MNKIARILENRTRILSRARHEEDKGTIMEDDRTLQYPEEAKDYITNIYENLYLARSQTKRMKNGCILFHEIHFYERVVHKLRAKS